MVLYLAVVSANMVGNDVCLMWCSNINTPISFLLREQWCGGDGKPTLGLLVSSTPGTDVLNTV